MTAPHRRWFRFAVSLRTMFVVVTVLCLWLGWQLNWIGDRHVALEWVASQAVYLRDAPVKQGGSRGRLTPSNIRMLGEPGMEYIVAIVTEHAEENFEIEPMEAKQREFKALLPESWVHVLRPKSGTHGIPPERLTDFSIPV